MSKSLDLKQLSQWQVILNWTNFILNYEFSKLSEVKSSSNSDVVILKYQW